MIRSRLRQAKAIRRLPDLEREAIFDQMTDFLTPVYSLAMANTTFPRSCTWCTSEAHYNDRHCAIDAPSYAALLGTNVHRHHVTSSPLLSSVLSTSRRNLPRHAASRTNVSPFLNPLISTNHPSTAHAAECHYAVLVRNLPVCLECRCSLPFHSQLAHRTLICAPSRHNLRCTLPHERIEGRVPRQMWLQIAEPPFPKTGGFFSLGAFLFCRLR